MPQSREAHRIYMRQWNETRRILRMPEPPEQGKGEAAGIFREWAESRLKVPTGPLSNQCFRIPDWQQSFVESLFAEGVREAALSVARKNGKSGLIAALFLCYLTGPLNRENWRGLVTSLTGRLAKELRDAIEQTAVASNMSVTVRRSPMPGVVYGARGSRLDFLAADKSTGHGSGADLALIDEAGLLSDRHRGLWNAVISSISGRNGRFGAISIQGDGAMFRELCDRTGDSTVRVHEYVSDMRAPIDSELTWLASNPGLVDGIKSKEYMADMVKRVKASPDNEADFRAFDLNQRLEPSREMVCTVSEWEACLTDTLPAAEGPCFVGIDLGGSQSMTCLAAAWPRTGRVETWGAFGGIPSLKERGLHDAVGERYLRMRERGELRVYEASRVTPVREFLSDVLGELSGRARVQAIGCDRFRKSEALDVYADLGLSHSVAWRGQGASATADGSADLRAFQKWVKRRFLKHKPSLLVESAIMSSAVRRDASGNPALDKGLKRGRIDCLSALVIACGLAELGREARPAQWAIV